MRASIWLFLLNFLHIFGWRLQTAASISVRTYTNIRRSWELSECFHCDYSSRRFGWLIQTDREAESSHMSEKAAANPYLVLEQKDDLPQTFQSWCLSCPIRQSLSLCLQTRPFLPSPSLLQTHHETSSTKLVL